MNKTKGRVPVIMTERNEKIVALRKLKFSYRKIALIFGISHVRVAKIVKQNDLCERMTT